MEPRELERRLKRKELAPVLLLWGEETLLMDEAIQAIEAIGFDAATREFNRDLFYGDEADAETILSAAQTIPWLASFRVVLVRRAEALPRASDDLLVSYCQHPSPSTCLLFTAQKIDPGRPLFATLAKLPWAVRFRRLSAGELSAWVERRVAARACRITPDAVAALVAALGNDLRLLASELDKLVTFVGPAATIDIAVLEAQTRDIGETSAFELARLLSAGEVGRALRTWEKLCASGESAGMALGAIAYHMRQLWRLKLLQQAGASPERIALELNIPTFAVRRVSEHAAKFASHSARQWFAALLDADQTLKRTGLPPETVFEALILRVCLGGKQ
jgi:DNA polymerase-3 subunit delta